MMYWILCVALLAGAASAFPQYEKEIESKSIDVLQRNPSVIQVEWYLFWSTIDWSHECSGSILTSHFIVSASSCFTGWSYEARFRRLRAGSSFSGAGGIIYYVQDRINHPRWEDEDYSGDVSIVRTMSAIVYNPVIQQASIASPGSWLPNGLQLNQPGFGRAEQPSISKQIVIVAARSNCERRDGSFSALFNATDDILCTIQAEAVSNHDVGGPWIFNNITVGIVSGVNTIGVYKNLIGADVAQYTEWIVHTVNTWW